MQSWARDQWMKMCFVEQLLNSRPLTPVSSDVQDLEALTPNHFLFGYKNNCLPCLTYAVEIVDHRKLFRQMQAYADLIWNRFRKKYIPVSNKKKVEATIEAIDSQRWFSLGHWRQDITLLEESMMWKLDQMVLFDLDLSRKIWCLLSTSCETGFSNGTWLYFPREVKQGQLCWDQLPKMRYDCQKTCWIFSFMHLKHLTVIYVSFVQTV